MVFSTGYDMSDDYKFDDGLGQLYAAIAGVWTIILAGGAMFLLYHRDLPAIRIRNVPLAISSVATLHVYWVLCMIAYGLNGHWPCNTEFWIMNIYLPLGIALFHASNSQLLFTAGQQQRFASPEYMVIGQAKTKSQGSGWRGRLKRLRNLRAMKQTMHSIAMGIAAQFLVSILVFLLSRRFNPRSGIMGEDISSPNTELSRVLCRHGLPSIFWQFFWAWIYAPYMLWRVRDIRDVHGWRMQTICCCLVGLPASPMWLLALYLPQMKNISRYFIPPLWFTPSIFLMELSMIFTPCWQILRNRRLKKETLEIIAEWERQKNGNSVESESSRAGTSSSMSQRPSIASSTSRRKAQSHLYTMTALEKALQTNHEPLLLFAALKDFSGENISFLNAVQTWKHAWTSSRRSSMLRLPQALNAVDGELRRKQFHKAIDIYSSFVSLKYSDFPINISSAHLKELKALFEDSAAVINRGSRRSNAATPFNDWNAAKSDDVEMQTGQHIPSRVSTPANGSVYGSTISESQDHQASVIENYRLKSFGDNLPDNISIPVLFSPNAFDEAVASIKYTVLTNTWPKFVNAGYTAQFESGSTVERIHEHVMECRTGFARLLSL